MGKRVIEEYICDEHEEDHEAPYEAMVTIKDRATGKVIGEYKIDVCEDVDNWYRSNRFFRKIVRHPVGKNVRRPRKRTPRKRAAVGKTSNEELRAWGRAHGFSVGSKGRVSQELRKAHAKAAAAH